MPKKKSTKKETFKIKGEEVVEKIKELIKEGNVHQITIKNKQGKEIMVIPVTVGVVGALFVPVLAAIGAMAALLSECTISVERK
jgi:hypothetical protein